MAGGFRMILAIQVVMRATSALDCTGDEACVDKSKGPALLQRDTSRVSGMVAPEPEPEPLPQASFDPVKFPSGVGEDGGDGGHEVPCDPVMDPVNCPPGDGQDGGDGWDEERCESWCLTDKRPWSDKCEYASACFACSDCEALELSKMEFPSGLGEDGGVGGDEVPCDPVMDPVNCPPGDGQDGGDGGDEVPCDPVMDPVNCPPGDGQDGGDGGDEAAREVHDEDMIGGPRSS